MKTLILVMAVLLSGCGANGTPLLLAAIYTNADKCQKDPTISYCGSNGTTYSITTLGARGTTTLVNVRNIDSYGKISNESMEQIHREVYGNFKTDAHGRILNWNEITQK